MHRPSSYRKPGQFNLCEYHFGLKGDGSFMGQSVPSSDTNIEAPGWAPTKRFSHRIYINIHVIIILWCLLTISTVEIRSTKTHDHLRNVFSSQPEIEAWTFSEEETLRNIKAHNKCFSWDPCGCGIVLCQRIWTTDGVVPNIAMNRRIPVSVDWLFRFSIPNAVCQTCSSVI